MPGAQVTGIAPFFVLRSVPTALAFYRDRLGFAVTFQGPSDDDIFFGIVQRDAAMIMLKSPLSFVSGHLSSEPARQRHMVRIVVRPYRYHLFEAQPVSDFPPIRRRGLRAGRCAARAELERFLKLRPRLASRG